MGFGVVGVVVVCVVVADGAAYAVDAIAGAAHEAVVGVAGVVVGGAAVVDGAKTSS